MGGKQSQTARGNTVVVASMEIQDQKLRRMGVRKVGTTGPGDILQNMSDFEWRRREIEQEEEERQLRLGFCDTLTRPPVLGSIKAELTPDKNRLFTVHHSSRGWREYERKIKTPRGELVTQNVLIGRERGSPNTCGCGVLTHRHQGVMYELFRIWTQGEKKIAEIEGRPRAFIAMSAYQLVKSICKKDHPENYNYVRRIVGELASIPISIKNAYTRYGIVRELGFRVLGEVEWNTTWERKKGERGPREAAQVYIQFSAVTTEGFLHGYLRNFCLDVYRGIRGSERKGRHSLVAAGLYVLLDAELATKEAYNISLAGLLAELGLRPGDYKSKRKDRIASAVDAVNGKAICGGAYRLHVCLRLSSDRSDYILVARRTQAVPSNQLSLFS
ncbi:MAG: hypothetical protein AAF471_07640 [Myxococcota bacterium]